jgi:formiminoglutamase
MDTSTDSMNAYFQKYKQSDIDSVVRLRNGETKLGELVAIPTEESLTVFLKNTRASFIIVGIAEDIGVLANYGTAGTATAWNQFLSSFLNIQANQFTKGEAIAVIGNFSFDRLKEQIQVKSNMQRLDITEYREAVALIDEAVYQLVRLIVSHEKIPIVVGGGHNNCYPLIKGTAVALGSIKVPGTSPINCVNLDAHMDFRVKEGRHSGNGFRYAKEEGFLNRYFAVGIHENYIIDGIAKEIAHVEDIDFVTYEEIFIREEKTWPQVLKDAVKFTRQQVTGIELDLDSIANVPSSAVSPCGFTTREAVQYVDYLAVHCKVAYLHVCEGIASDGNNVGKLISTIVSQFTKSCPLETKP